MGFGLNRLKDASLDGAKQGAVEALEQQGADDQDTVDAPAPRANAFAPFSRPSFAPPSVAPVASPTASQASAPAAPSRPSFGPPSTSDAPSGTPNAFAPRRPSFGAPASTPVPAASASPSSSNTPPPNSAQAQRPSLNGAPGSSQMPNARGVFRKPASSASDERSSGGDHGASSKLDPQALFEIICTHRKLSAQAIAAARAQMLKNPDSVYANMRQLYDKEIAPRRNKQALDLPQACDDNPDKIVFLLRKDEMERLRVMSIEDAEKTGEVLLNRSMVESIQASASPFAAPSELFAPKAAPQTEEVPTPEEIQNPARSAPRP